MKATGKTKRWIAILVWLGCIRVCAGPFAKGPYLGQTPPGRKAQIFAPGPVCCPGNLWESDGHFSMDGKVFCYRQGLDVYVTEDTNQSWTVPERITGLATDVLWAPTLAPDGKLGPPMSSPEGELVLCFAGNNNAYIGSKRKRKDPRSNIWFAPFVGNTWSQAAHINLKHQAGDPGIAPDESFMVFTATNHPGGYGMRDLYLTLHLPDGTWSKPKNLGPRINSAYFEYSPRVSPDKKYLFFTRANGWGLYGGPGDTGDIYWVELKEYLLESYR